jgi:hypothetical protein
MIHEIPTTFTFHGVFKVAGAQSKEQAEELVRKHCGFCAGGEFHSSLPEEDIDWNFPVHPEKTVGEQEAPKGNPVAVIEEIGDQRAITLHNSPEEAENYATDIALENTSYTAEEIRTHLRQRDHHQEGDYRVSITKTTSP